MVLLIGVVALAVVLAVIVVDVLAANAFVRHKSATSGRASARSYSAYGCAGFVLGPVAGLGIACLYVASLPQPRDEYSVVGHGIVLVISCAVGLLGGILAGPWLGYGMKSMCDSTDKEPEKASVKAHPASKGRPR